MKKTLVNKILLFASIVVAMSFTASAQNVTFNDTNFKNALLAHDPVIDTNGDMEIQVSEAEAFTGFLNLYNQIISDATGLEAFINITRLDISQNSLTSLDITDLTALTYLSAYSNSLPTIDISQNTQLDTLALFDNQLTTLDLSSNTALIYVVVAINQLTSIDVTNNINLKGISFYNNDVSSFTFPTSIESSLTQLGYGDNPISNTFDFTQFPNLEYLDCRTSNLTSLDVSSLSNLKTLFMVDNPITSIDLSQNTALESLYTSNTSMTELDLSSNINLKFFYHWSSDIFTTESLIETINLANGNNDKLESIFLGDNPNLACIQVDDQSDPFPNATRLTLNGFSNFRDVCIPGEILFVDPQFKDALLAHDPAIDTNGDGAITTTEAAAYTGTLDIGQRPIKNVHEIKYFTSITGLDVAQTDIGNLDLSANSALTTLDISGISELRFLSLDNGNNEAITDITWASWYPSCITVDDPTYSENNWDFFPAASYSTDCIAVGGASAFGARLVADGYDLNEDGDISVSEAEQIVELKYSAYTNLFTIGGFEAFTALETLELPTTFNTTTINLSQCTSLDKISMPGSNLSSLDLSCNPVLTWLILSNSDNTSFKTLDLSYNKALSTLSLFNSHFESIDIANCKELRSVTVQGNNLTELDLSHASKLSALQAYSNNLQSLNIKNGNNESLILNVTDNPNLSCVTVDDPVYAEANFTNVDETVFFDVDCADQPIQFVDSNLETALLNYTPAIDLNADGDIRLSEAAAFTGVLNLSGLSIETADELQYFTSATGLDISDNNLTVLNIRNGNNKNFTVFDATGNAGLSCIKVDQAVYSEENWTNIDPGVSFSAYCDMDEIVYIPDPHLKTFLLSYADDNGDDEITYEEALGFTGTFNSGFNFFANDMTGIEAFENMTGLDLRFRETSTITEVDLSALTQLITLSVDPNQAAMLSDLYLPISTTLENLTIRRIPVDGIDLSVYPNLTSLNCNRCELTSIDVSQNTKLTGLYLYYNFFTTIDLTNNTMLTRLDLVDNPLEAIDVSMLVELTDLYLSGNFTSLDVSALTNLQNIEVINPQFKSIDLSNNLNLTDVRFYGDGDVEESFIRSKLEEIIFGENTLIDYMELEGNSLRSLDLSFMIFPSRYVSAASNLLEELNVGLIQSLYIVDNPDLTCAQTTDVAYAEANYDYDEGVTFSTYCESKQNDIVSFVLAEQVSEAVIDRENHTVGIEVEIGTDVTSLTPTITVSDNATYSPEGAQDFTNTVVYTVTAEDGSTQDWDVSVIVGENTAPTLETAFEDLSEEEGFSSVLISYANAFADADGHSLTISVESSDTDVVTAMVASNNNIEITEVSIGTSTITVTASDGFGGSVSDEFTFTVTEAPNNAPIVATPIEDKSFEEGFESTTVSLIDVFTDQDGDVLTYSASSNNHEIATVAVNGAILTIAEVGIGTATITVTTTDGNGGSVSDEFTFTVTEAPLGLLESLNIQVYPNPTTDFLNIGSSKSLDIMLIDLNGRVLQTNNGMNLLMDLRAIESGMYLLKISDGESTETKRIIKAN